MNAPRFAAAFGLSIACSAALGQAPPPAASAPPKHVAVATVLARADEVATLDGIVKAYYEVISGPAAQPRQWARDRTLYDPGVRFVEVEESKSGEITAHVWTHQDYVDRTDASLVATGFDEREIHRVTEEFGSIVNIFSTYESRRTAGGPVIARGVNGLQLFHDGKPWWILGATWQSESPKLPIPKQLLP